MNTWLKGLGVAVGSALITALLAGTLAPQSFNFTKAGMLRLLALAGPIALKAVWLYLRQSPIPGATNAEKAALAAIAQKADSKP